MLDMLMTIHYQKQAKKIPVNQVHVMSVTIIREEKDEETSPTDWRLSVWLFVLSIVSLCIGVLAFPLLRRRGEWLALLDGFVLVSVGGLVLVHVLPHSLRRGGGWAVFALFLGLLLPILLEWGASKGLWQEGATKPLGWLVLFAVAIHSMLDGMALSLVGSKHTDWNMLALGVVLHRVPVGIALAWFVYPGKKRSGAWLAVSSISLFTALGYLLGHETFSKLQQEWLMVFQAMMAGMLLHVLFGHEPPTVDIRSSDKRRWSFGGVMLGIVLLVALSWNHSSAHPQMNVLTMEQTFLWLTLESAPALLLAFLGAGALHAFIRPASMAWLWRGSSLSQSLRGMAFGLPLPICSCGVVPFYQSLIRAGAPGTAAIAFLIATPELGFDAILLSLPLLGVELTALRLVTAIIAAVVVALLVGQLCMPDKEVQSETQEQPTTPLMMRLREGLHYGFGEMFDHIMPWILFGLLLAALLEPAMPLGSLSKLPSMLQVPLMAIAGMPLYVCASGTTPLVAILLHKGLSPGAAIAFLLTGPATNITTFGLLRSLHGPRAAFAFAGAMFVVSCSLGWGVNILFPIAQHAQTLHTSANQSPGIINITSLVILGALVLMSLWRCGPRFMIGQVFQIAGNDHDHSHDHDHGHGHSHSHDHFHVHQNDENDHSHGHQHHAHEHKHSHHHGTRDGHEHAHHSDHDHDHQHGTCDGHNHDHGHEHDHQHGTCDGHTHDHQHHDDEHGTCKSHSHEHKHHDDEHETCDGHTHDHQHREHQHDHDHEHGTCDGHNHDHGHEHDHQHGHHDHGHQHDHDHHEHDHDHHHE